MYIYVFVAKETTSLQHQYIYDTKLKSTLYSTSGQNIVVHQKVTHN